MPLPDDFSNENTDERATDGSAREETSLNRPRSSRAVSHQVELFETEPPPWELAAADDVAIATVVFSEAPYGPYDYRIPDILREELKPAMRVRVPLGKRRKPVTGWCIELKMGSAAQRTLRDID